MTSIIRSHTRAIHVDGSSCDRAVTTHDCPLNHDYYTPRTNGDWNRISDSEYIGQAFVYRRNDPPVPGPHDSNVVLAPGMHVEVLSVFHTWNGVPRLNIAYVAVPETGYTTHVTLHDLGIF